VIQNSPLDAEVIIVDDNSNDGTKELVNLLANQYNIRFHPFFDLESRKY